VDLFTELAGALRAGLSIWESKEKTKYIDRLIRLERERDEEGKKPDPNMAVLDDLEFQLVLLSRAFSAAAIGGQKTSAQA
jgi:hypothetical protein